MHQRRMRLTNAADRTLRWLIACVVLASCRPERPHLAFIDTTGQVRIRLQPGQGATSFSEGLAAVSSNNSWGYIDASGTYLIAPRFGAASEFAEDIALVTTAKADEYWNRTTLFGYIDRAGKFVISPRFNWASSFSEGVAPVCTGPCRGPDLAKARIGYIDRNGRYVLEPRWASAGRFSEGRAWVSEIPGLRPSMGLIDRSGNFVSPARFAWAEEFSHGLAATDQGFVNKESDLVISQRLATNEAGFSDGWAVAVEGERLVFIDTTGKIVLRPDCQNVGSYSEGLAPACNGDCGLSSGGQNWGYINKAGKFVIPPQFGYKPGPFRRGLALVCFGCTG